MNTSIIRSLRTVSALTLSLAAAGLLGWAAKPGDLPPVKLEVDERPITRDPRIGNSFAPVVKKVAPSVVKIVTATKPKLGSGTSLNQELNIPFFRRFFGDDFDSPNAEPSFRIPRQQGVGSGVVVTKDGYVLTNNHVVDGADEVKVSLQDGREFQAKVIGKDPKTDVAVIKIEATGLPAIEITNSDKIEVGDLVLAVGNPFGIGQTVTMGMVSATGRATLGLDYEDFIQTDAAINPGNSGGALVDTEGRLVGVNTAILSRTGGNQGIGFAIPINLARGVMESLITDGRVTRGYLGVIIQDVTPNLAKQFKLEDKKGALVGEVTPKSPAEKAGLESGDIIVELDGKSVADSRHLKLQVARLKPGESVSARVLRDGESKNFKIKVGELPGDDSMAKSRSEKKEDEGTLNDIEVGDLDGRLRRQFNIPENVRGAVVMQVEPDSASAEAGIRPGDVILEINREKVRGADDAVHLTEKPKDKTTLLKLWSRGSTRFVVVDESGEKRH